MACTSDMFSALLFDAPEQFFLNVATGNGFHVIEVYVMFLIGALVVTF